MCYSKFINEPQKMNYFFTNQSAGEETTAFLAAWFCPPRTRTKKISGANNQQILPSSWYDPRRCKYPPGDADDDGAATPEAVFVQSQTAMMSSDPRVDVPAVLNDPRT